MPEGSRTVQYPLVASGLLGARRGDWRFDATLGKHIVGVQVRSLGGAPLGTAQAGKRILPRLIVLLSANATDSILGSSTETHRISLNLVTSRSIADFGLWSDVLNFLALPYLISFVVATSRRTLPLRDRWADTEAVRPIASPSR
jgi:hypothetical protein